LLESILVGLIALRIDDRVLGMLGIEDPQYRTAEARLGLESWKIWADSTRDVVGSRLLKLERDVDTFKGAEVLSTDQEETLREYQQLDTIYSQLGVFLDYVDDTWLFDRTTRAMAFRPLWLTPELTSKYLFQYADKFLFMSATVPPANVLGMLLGISPADIDYMELPSLWPVENRRVYLDPVADMKYSTIDQDIPKLLKRIEYILAKHKHEKGVIHTTSYKLTQAVMNIDKKGTRLITHNGFNKSEQVQWFKKSKLPLVLVSPSSTRGLSLEGDSCRFIIFAKAPYLNLRDKLVNRRIYGSYMGKLWYRSMCADDILQGSYRAVRSENDWCVTYCLDKQILHLVTNHQSLFPRYFLEAVDVT